MRFIERHIILTMDREKIRFLLAVCAAFLVFRGPSAMAVEGISGNEGEISGIDSSSHTVVVEVPLDGRRYTVGGELVPDALLKRGGMKAGLKDFRVGDMVRVRWKKTERGHRITFLEFISSCTESLPGGVYSYSTAKTVIGTLQRHIIKERETLLDVARQYDLGFNEIQDLYSHLDPWIPPKGTALIIPSQWIIPEIPLDGIVINVAELRLYYFMKTSVITFPIGIGDREWTTPLGFFRISEKRVRPAWFIPPSLQSKYGVKIIPPGPDNPLGDYWIGLGNSRYGIHGSDIPWSIGRLVTHGCIRMYPEDIRQLFDMVKPGTPVKIVYEPVKIGILSGKIYAEVHQDIYGKTGDFVKYGYLRLSKRGIVPKVDLGKFRQALERQDGMPVNVTRPIP